MARTVTKLRPVRLHAIKGRASRPVAVPRIPSGPPSVTLPSPPISNAQLGMAIFIAFETMVFVALVTAYLVLRGKSFAWPPPDLPRLPLAVTCVNTAVLLFSAYAMWRASVAIRHNSRNRLRSALTVTAILGTAFLVVQGSEWVQLVRHGLTPSAGSYGSTFYTLIGLHALHVVGAVIWLLVVLVMAQRGRYTPTRHIGFTLCAMYWYFVCILWVCLFAMVYVY